MAASPPHCGGTYSDNIATCSGTQSGALPTGPCGISLLLWGWTCGRFLEPAEVGEHQRLPTTFGSVRRLRGTDEGRLLSNGADAPDDMSPVPIEMPEGKTLRRTSFRWGFMF